MLPNNRHVRSLPVLLHSKEVTEIMVRMIIKYRDYAGRCQYRNPSV